MTPNDTRERPPVERPLTSSVVRLLSLSLLVASAYSLGAAVGLALKLPNATPSVLWPPNAILTAIFLMTPYRLWPIVVLSALPAHVVLESGVGWPASMVLALFATNCVEALIAASGVRWLSDAPTRFDSLRRVGVFVGMAVIAAPFLSSFLDAAVVSWVRGEPYWQVWTSRLFANMLAELALVPALVMLVTSGPHWLRTAPRSRHLEAFLLASTMFLVGVILLHTPGRERVTTALAERAPLIWLLPLLLWAATRFGPGGASLTVLASAVLLTGAAVHSQGPFQGLSPADTTLALQLILIVVSLPLMVVAALIEERRLIQQDISDRFAFEALLAQLSGAFVHLPSNRMRDVFSESLRRIGEFLALDSVMLLEYSDAMGDMTLEASWTAPGSERVPAILTRANFRWPMDRLSQGDPTRVEDLLGNAGEADGSTSFEEHGLLSGLALPLMAEEKMLGVLAFTSRSSGGASHSALVSRQIQSIARILATLMSRKQSEDALRASEVMKSAILSSLSNGVVVVDREGRIITVNRQWRRMVGQDGSPAATEAGEHYLEFYRSAARAGQPWAAAAADGIEAVAVGTTRHFQLEHVSSSPKGDRTIVTRAVPLERREGGAVVTHVDVSDQRRAEGEAQLARAELAHVSRVATMGALTASIAHQLNQPLTGILTNAQAVNRVLSAASPSLGDARAGLGDIMEDCRRASDVIMRMRELLRKDPGSGAEIDINLLVRDVAHLLSSDAIIRGVALLLTCGSEPALVRGDRVQLQQVVLNLIVNALEAFANGTSTDRRVTVCCTRPGQSFVEISVIDNGMGFNGAEQSAFEPFNTTKQNGMGLGLSIARSIVDAHGGIIRASTNLEGGATVYFRLPLAQHSTT